MSAGENGGHQGGASSTGRRLSVESTDLANGALTRASQQQRAARWRLWVIRVDMAMSALSSAIDGTGHYHVRPRPVCLWPSCVRSANNGHNRRRDLGRNKRSALRLLGRKPSDMPTGPPRRLRCDDAAQIRCACGVQ